MKTNETGFMSFKQKGAIVIKSDKPEKLAD